MVRLVGVPRCSCSRIKSDVDVEWHDEHSNGRTVLPRLSRMLLGRSSRISLENWSRRDEGSREVVMRILGSTIPERCAYSSSSSAVSSAAGVCDSSYLKSLRSCTSSAMSLGRGYCVQYVNFPGLWR